MSGLPRILVAVVNSLWQALLVAVLVWAALKLLARTKVAVNAATRYIIWWAALGVVLILPLAPQPLPDVARPARLLLSGEIASPMAVGFLRPAVLLPETLLDELSEKELDHVLLHEVAHLARRDDWTNLIARLAGAALALHPVAVWILREIELEREMACDDWVVARIGSARPYAASLARLCELRWAQRGDALATGLFGRGSRVGDRIESLLRGGRTFSARASLARVAASTAALAGLVIAASFAPQWIAFAQPTARFEVASIRQNKSDWSERYRHPMGGGYQPGGRLVMRDSSLSLLLRFAYADHDNLASGHWAPLLASQIVGGPSWIDSVGYDIEAEPEHKPDPQHMWLMLQNLLADRFKLALHRETRDLPVYVLTAAKRGFKLAPASEADCVSFPPGVTPRQVPGKVDCGYVSGPILEGAGKLRIGGSKVHMADLARELGSILDRPVVDRTGFTGEFDLNLSFAPDSSLAGLPASRLGGTTGSTESNGPDIFAALREQLGLKIESGKVPVEVLVIDHVERPDAN
jgi:bla regulator protein blaR1